MKSRLHVFFCGFLLVGCAVAPQQSGAPERSIPAQRKAEPGGAAKQGQKFLPTSASRNQAMASGQGREYIAAMEVLGVEEEDKQRWVAASEAYRQAS